MQNVSQEWKDNQNELLTPESFVEVVLTLTDPDAYADASAEDNGAIYISNTEQVVSEVDKEIEPYATLELNLWILDGSREIIPQSDYGDCGFIGNSLSVTDGRFVDPPVVTVNFSKIHNNLIPGVTITWGNAYDDYATDFVVTAYNGDTVVATKEITGNNKVKSIIEMDIAEYDRITITISKWCSPYRRARISEILPGVEKTYDKSNLFSFDHSQEVDPISASLPKSAISFSIDNSDNSYNPNNLDGISKYLIERQELKSRYGYKTGNKIEWLDCGTFYMSEWDAPQGGMTADFKARDLLEFMTGTFYYGVYSPNGVSLYDLAVAVLQDADLPLEDDGAVKWVIDESLKNIYTVSPLPIDTHANCLQLIANAGECVIFQDRKGILHMTKTPTVSNLANANNLSNLYVDGNGVTWINPHLYSYIIPIEPFVTYDFRTKCLPNLRNVAFTKGYPENNDITYDSEGKEGAVTRWDTTDVFQITPNDKDYTHIIVTFYSTEGSNTYTLDEIMDGFYIGKSSQEYRINAFNSYSKSDVTLSKPLKQVDVPCYSYSIAEQSSELYKGEMNIVGSAELVITYSGTATDVTATVSGGTLNSARYYANACVLNIAASGNVTITVTGKLLETSSIKMITVSGNTGETISVDNLLITSQDRAVAIGRWVESYMKNRMTLSSDWRADPRLDALDIVDNENDYNTNKVLITNVKYSYKGAFKGTCEGRVI